MEVHGRIAGSSNATLLVTCRLGDDELRAVYKPIKGERPLWDFPGGLFRREVAAYHLSESLGWGLVPETVQRTEGPFGEGSVQRYVPEDGASHYFTLRDDPKWHPTLKRMCAFDVVANNADRKSGHVLLAEERLWAIDNGLCFNEDDKLRTVIWDFGGQPLAPDDTAAFSSALTAHLTKRRAELTTDGQLLPGAKEALAAVADLDGVVQTVLTGSSRPGAELKLAAFGLDKYLDVEVGGYAGSDPYPKGTLLLRARQRAVEAYGVTFLDTVDRKSVV